MRYYLLLDACLIVTDVLIHELPKQVRFLLHFFFALVFVVGCGLCLDVSLPSRRYSRLSSIPSTWTVWALSQLRIATFCKVIGWSIVDFVSLCLDRPTSTKIWWAYHITWPVIIKIRPLNWYLSQIRETLRNRLVTHLKFRSHIFILLLLSSINFIQIHIAPHLLEWMTIIWATVKWVLDTSWWSLWYSTDVGFWIWVIP